MEVRKERNEPVHNCDLRSGHRGETDLDCVVRVLEQRPQQPDSVQVPDLGKTTSGKAGSSRVRHAHTSLADVVFIHHLEHSSTWRSESCIVALSELWTRPFLWWPSTKWFPNSHKKLFVCLIRFTLPCFPLYLSNKVGGLLKIVRIGGLL